ncbi:DegT/DnrJ/EryC1/StrS family aminotransferase [Flavobacterium sp. WLB]|uniref:DegT/DnrJ/EryC1/StrS family aminotransferase n=1 Tax=unclassified Flavobacterium TaxID=196869 RepID=UPI0006AB856A|nr:MULTISPECIES: DegT/DnrJ/EryC1/StrS family aminotransferase [unclassified Flavobacterium]KOP36603.1 aminotransferase DegT [Flavobacterium sp. VMW]OWU91975.1 aminotransferase DegT [Flavobacterium sp. NLM]PUU69021.1 DegT/DnrJ/EryC1/StrS family aminotransferase [Flavobacterium sp. WLB]
MIPVTKTFLPPQEEYNSYVKRAWDKVWLTNRGELTLELEDKLKNLLGVSNLIITNNGTIPIQIALKLFGEGGEIITTPFSYVATSAAIVWENCKPVFVDINQDYLTIDETKIEAAITPKTTAILATHVFGNPCDVIAIENIAKKHNLKVIYDAAHCFGVKFDNQSVFNFGDVSTCSFHATKLFHTGEGGAMFCNDAAIFHQLYYSHNFGHNGPLAFHGLGINAKISELQSALGLAVLPYMDHIISERKKVVDFYNNNLNFNTVKTLKIRENTEWNYSYYPVILDSEETLLRVLEALANNNIIPRRYFYPSLNTIEYTKGEKMPVSESIASRILCLPLYVGISEADLKNITQIINTQTL